MSNNKKPVQLQSSGAVRQYSDANQMRKRKKRAEDTVDVASEIEDMIQKIQLRPNESIEKRDILKILRILKKMQNSAM